MMATGNDTIPIVRLADPSYQPQGQSDSTLLIHLSLSYLSFAVYHNVSNTVVAYCHHNLVGEERFSEALHILSSDEWTRATHSKVKVVLEPDAFVLVPKDLFDPREITTYLNFHSFNEVNSSQLFDNMSNIGVVGAYQVSHFVLEALNRQFLNLNILSSPTPFIQLISREYKSTKGDNLFVHLDDNRMHILVLNQSRLVYYNSFEIASKEDVSYYALAACEQLHFSPEKAVVMVWGNGYGFEEQYNKLKYYFRNVEQGVRPLAMKFADSLNSLPVFSEYTLFAATICE
jgi:hypothetical protein